MKGKTRLIILCFALVILLTTAVGILSGPASSLLPEPIIYYVWPLLGIVILLLIGVTVLQYRLQSETESSTQPLSGQNRQRLIAKVRSFWITGFLEQSLHGTALMALGLQSQPDVLDNPWRLVLQQSDQSAHILAAGTHITQVYDEGPGELLILGEPGAGKTTLLLELARDLLSRAERDESLPIPMVFNLSSWAVKRQPLADWLVEEMNTKYLADIWR